MIKYTAEVHNKFLKTFDFLLLYFVLFTCKITEEFTQMPQASGVGLWELSSVSSHLEMAKVYNDCAIRTLAHLKISSSNCL